MPTTYTDIWARVDGISNSLLKSIKLEIVQPVTVLINQMLTTGIFSR